MPIADKMCFGNDIARITWIKQLRSTGVKKNEVEAAFEQLLSLQYRDNELLLEISRKNNTANEPNCKLTTHPSVPTSVQNHATITKPSAPPNIASVDNNSDRLRNGSQGNGEVNLPVLPAGISITAVTPASQEKPFSSLDEFEKQFKIREFVFMHSISEHVVSELTRIQLPLLKRYFSGVVDAISANAKQLLFQWYLKIRCDPKKLQSIRRQMESSKRKQSELIQVKRERFIFRKQHIEILEKAFNENKYPDLFAKEDIVKACNDAVKSLTGSPVLPREQVTVPIVSNWFNNKRKEAKLRSKNKRLRVNDSNVIVNIELDSEISNSSSLYSDFSKSYDSPFDVPSFDDLKDIPDEIVVDKTINQKTSIQPTPTLIIDEEDIEEMTI